MLEIHPSSGVNIKVPQDQKYWQARNPRFAEETKYSIKLEIPGWVYS